MEVLNKTVPPEIEALNEAVVALRPDANMKFVAEVRTGATIKGRHQPDLHGNSEIRLGEDYDFGALAHGLLHALYYRRGFPVATTAPFDISFATVAEIINCAASHAALHEEAAELKLPAALWRDYVIGAAALTGPDEPALTEEGLLNAWLLADALTLDEAAMAGLAETCRADYPETWVVVQRLRRTIEYCRTHSGLRWRRGMVELLRYFDAMAREHHPTVLPPTQTILISLVLSEPQVKRPAERLFEIAPISSRVAGFLHKQDGSLFHVRFFGPGSEKRELASLRAAMKKMRVEEFLDEFQVPYSVDLGAARAAARA